jgi:hypothetical protein
MDSSNSERQKIKMSVHFHLTSELSCFVENNTDHGIKKKTKCCEFRKVFERPQPWLGYCLCTSKSVRSYASDSHKANMDNFDILVKVDWVCKFRRI